MTPLSKTGKQSNMSNWENINTEGWKAPEVEGWENINTEGWEAPEVEGWVKDQEEDPKKELKKDNL
jgi:hypothetical protein